MLYWYIYAVLQCPWLKKQCAAVAAVASEQGPGATMRSSLACSLDARASDTRLISSCSCLQIQQPAAIAIELEERYMIHDTIYRVLNIYVCSYEMIMGDEWVCNVSNWRYCSPFVEHRMIPRTTFHSFLCPQGFLVVGLSATPVVWYDMVWCGVVW